MPLTDLDDLLLTVRDRNCRSYVAEAIDTYRTRSYRSSIMATWIAVSYDIISKIRELSGQGEGAALAFVADLDNALDAQRRGDPEAVKRLLSIENDLLTKATDEFEFLTQQQSRDLDRLKSDRNLCAHPAFTTGDLLYQPSTEQARTHIVHAIDYLLRQPPVQGRSALLRLKADMLQPSFPTVQDVVNAFLDAKYFNHSKESLRVSIHAVLLKLVVRQNDPDLKGKETSILQCLIAFRNRYQVDYEALTPDLLRRLTDHASDEELSRAVSLLTLDKNTWGWLPDHTQIRLKELAAKVDIAMNNFEFIISGIKVPDLRPIYIEAIGKLDEEKRVELIMRSPQEEFCDTALEIYAKVNSWRMAERILEQAVLPLANYFTVSQVEQICNIIVDNHDVRTAHGTPVLLNQLFAKTYASNPEVSVPWIDLLGKLGSRGSIYFMLLQEMMDADVELPHLTPNNQDDEDEE